jgi:hypothetical protein
MKRPVQWCCSWWRRQRGGGGGPAAACTMAGGSSNGCPPVDAGIEAGFPGHVVGGGFVQNVIPNREGGMPFHFWTNGQEVKHGWQDERSFPHYRTVQDAQIHKGGIERYAETAGVLHSAKVRTRDVASEETGVDTQPSRSTIACVCNRGNLAQATGYTYRCYSPMIIYLLSTGMIGCFYGFALR